MPMPKVFNTTAVCFPDKHYMIDLTGRLVAIKALVDHEKYFTINRARQYGKTTTLRALSSYLQKDYYIVLMDFQTFDYSKFENSNRFSLTFAAFFLKALERNTLSNMNDLKAACSELKRAIREKDIDFSLTDLFASLGQICHASDKPIVLMIDEVLCSDGTSRSSIWTKTGFLKAVRLLLAENNTLFSSLINKLHDYPDLNTMLRSILFSGQSYTYSVDNDTIQMAAMFGFIKNMNGTVAIANRIFETRLYNYYLSKDEWQQTALYKASLQDKNQFIIELKLWHGEEYHSRGEQQLIQYLDAYHTDIGYMLSFNFNKNKEPGVHEILIGNKKIIEAVV